MRRFRFQYSASIESPHAKLWLPVPQSDAYQQIDGLTIDAAIAHLSKLLA